MIRYSFYTLICVYFLLLPSLLSAAIIGPIRSSGMLNFVYQFNQSAEGVSSGVRSVTVSRYFNSYVWQPWFISWSSSVSAARTEVNGVDTTSSNLSGGLSLEILPRSRFPLTLNYTVTNSYSATELRGGTSSNLSIDRVVRTRTFSAFQTYNSWGGVHYSFWYNESNLDAPAVRVGEAREWGLNQSIGVSMSRRLERHSVELNASDHSSSSRLASSVSRSAALTHNYSPEHEFGVTSSISVRQSGDNQDVSEKKNFSSSSAFFWRPNYSDFSINGSVKASGSDTSGEIEKSLSTQLSGGYRLSRKVRINGSISAQLSEGITGVRDGSSSQNLSLSYSSDRILIRKFQWGWNTSGSLSNSFSRGGGGEENSSNLGLSFGHSANRQIDIDKSSSVGLSVSQSLSLSKAISSSDDTSVDGVSKGMSHSISSNYRTSAQSGTSSIWGSLSDSRDLSESTAQQGFTMSFTQNNRLNRVSNLTGTVSYSYSVSTDAGGVRTSSSGNSGSMAYSNSKLWGIHRLVLRSSLRLSEISAASASTEIATSLTSRFTYQIGLLSVSFNASHLLRTNRTGVDQRYTFSVTRSF